MRGMPKRITDGSALNKNWLSSPQARRRRIAKDKPLSQIRQYFRLGEVASQLFNEIRSELREVSQDMTAGKVIELLTAHWREHPPDPFWVLNYPFKVQRGRPKGEGGRIERKPSP